VTHNLSCPCLDLILSACDIYSGVALCFLYLGCNSFKELILDTPP